MKFSHTLSLNANPDWEEDYIDYAALKKKINEINAKTHEEGLENPKAIFLEKLTRMVKHVHDFFYTKHAELEKEMTRLQPILEKSASQQNLQGLTDEDTPLLKPTIAQSMLEDKRAEICDLFTRYHNLQLYGELNCTAVRKILKKYDKTLNDDLKGTHLSSFKQMLPFWDGAPTIEHAMETLKHYFTHFYCNDDEDEAERRLMLMVRELVTYQRHSVWLDVVQDHRKNEEAQTTAPYLRKGDDAFKRGSKWFSPILQLTLATQLGLVGFVVFLAILWTPGIFDNDSAKRNALALLVLVSILWAAETFALFVTAMLVPFLAVILRVIVIDGTRLDAKSASQHVFAAMFSHVIMLLLGGFSIAAALSKHNVAKVVASGIGRHFGSGTRMVLLVNIFIATISSMWISNVAAPVLCFSLISPILKEATAQSSRAAFGTNQEQSANRDHRLCRALVMGIALASNVGGMASPISSPQNLFAIEYTPIGWFAWFVVSIPLCIILDLIIFAWLVYCFDLPNVESTAVSYALQRDRSGSEKFTLQQYYVIVVSVGVVLLWCASLDMESLTGQMGVLGIIPFAMFFGTGVLSKQDLNNFLWGVVILAMGGLVLGEAVKTSGLLDVIAENIGDSIEYHSLSLWTTLSIFTFLILVCTTFVSHTVGAIVVIPIVQAIGSQMHPTSHAKELVFAAALACSAAMGLPVSGFPNMCAVSVEDSLGNRFVNTSDFLKYAVPASLFSWVVLVTLGYWLITIAADIDH